MLFLTIIAKNNELIRIYAMFIEFSVKNYRSIRDKQTLSLTRAKGGELQESNVFSPDTAGGMELLRTAAIYGPNAGGKTNLIMAVKAMQRIVLESATQRQHGDTLPVKPFLLDEMTADTPIEFEIVFIAGGVRYQYGFATTTERIVEEWLLAFPKGRPQRWFGRIWNSKKNTHEWEMGSSLQGQKQLWQESTRPNALFLSTAVQLNSTQLQPVYDWFKNTLRMVRLDGWSPAFTASLCEKSDQRAKILEFLKAADLDIHDVEVESEKMSAKHLPGDMPEELKIRLLEDMKDKEVYDIKTVHRTTQGKTVRFNFNEESHGTQKFFAMAGPFLDTLEHGYVLFIDELHDNFHPQMVKFLVKLFHSNKTNPNNAQLIFTTHETSILNQEVFRRDQIWFCEKDEQQATILYPLTDFSPRKGRENLEVSYLSGRYGALPNLRIVNKL
jgi:hypothetical protein